VNTADLHELARALAPLIAEQPGPAPLLDGDQAAELLQVPKSWLMSQAKAGAVPHVKLGHYVRFDRDALLAWVDKRSVGPRAVR
jgi:excisionase family DNA binding protein